MSGGLDTTQLLHRWHGGDRSALDVLLERDLPWIRARVSRRLGPRLRAKADTVDFVQDAMVEVLTYCPRFTVASRDKFRALLSRIIENVLRDKDDLFKARRRDLSREVALPRDTVLQLDVRAQPTRPEVAAERHEERAWLLLGLELVSPADRDLILMRQWDGLEFEVIGERLGIAANTARMRFQRALARLAARVDDVRTGRWDDRKAVGQ